MLLSYLVCIRVTMEFLFIFGITIFMENPKVCKLYSPQKIVPYDATLNVSLNNNYTT